MIFHCSEKRINDTLNAVNLESEIFIHNSRFYLNQRKWLVVSKLGLYIVDICPNAINVINWKRVAKYQTRLFLQLIIEMKFHQNQNFGS